jgi:hypothetical protein
MKVNQLLILVNLSLTEISSKDHTNVGIFVRLLLTRLAVFGQSSQNQIPGDAQWTPPIPITALPGTLALSSFSIADSAATACAPNVFSEAAGEAGSTRLRN